MVSISDSGGRCLKMYVTCSGAFIVAVFPIGVVVNALNFVIEM